MPPRAPSKIDWTTDAQRLLFHVKVRSTVAAADVRSAWTALRRAKDFRLGMPLVIDLTEATVPTRATIDAVDRNARANPGDLVFGRIGVVAIDDTIRAFAYQFKPLIRSYGTAMQVFRESHDAVAWCERGERPTANTDDERWRRHDRARRAREALATATRDCAAKSSPTRLDLLTDTSVQALHDCVRSYTLACRSLGEEEEVIQWLVSRFLRSVASKAVLHPAFAAAIKDWVAEAYRQVA